jgi:hypothetical protein
MSIIKEEFLAGIQILFGVQSDSVDTVDKNHSAEAMRLKVSLLNVIETLRNCPENV